MILSTAGSIAVPPSDGCGATVAPRALPAACVSSIAALMAPAVET